MVPAVTTWKVSVPPSSTSSEKNGKELRFIAGSENRIAAYLPSYLLGTPAGNELGPFDCSPIVLYGPPGSGKSLWLEMLAWELRLHWQSVRVRLYTAADWLRFGDSDRTSTGSDGGLETSSQRPRRALLLDDLHKVNHTDAVQLHLMRLMDDFTAAGDLLVLSLAVHPTQTSFHPGLRSRLAQGLCLSLAEPGLAARGEILKQLVAELGWVATDESLLAVARDSSGTPRDLRSILISRMGMLPDGSALKMPSPNHRPGTASPPRISTSTVIAAAAKYFRLSVRDLAGTSRRRTVVTARGMAILLCRSLCQASLQEIGAALGNRDHSTIINAVRRMQQLRDQDASIRQAYDDLVESLSQDTE